MIKSYKIIPKRAELIKKQANESGTKMRVLMVTPSFYPIEGGTETMVRNLSIELNKVGVHVDVMTFNMDRKWNPKWRKKIEKIDKKFKAFDNIYYINISSLFWYTLRFLHKFCKMVKKAYIFKMHTYFEG